MKIQVKDSGHRLINSFTIEDGEPVVLSGNLPKGFRIEISETFEQVCHQWAKDAKKLFPNATAITSLIHLGKEIKELQYELSDSDGQIDLLYAEYVDCFLCLMSSFSFAMKYKNIDWKHFFNFIDAKIEVNKGRTWKENADGTYSHVK